MAPKPDRRHTDRRVPPDTCRRPTCRHPDGDHREGKLECLAEGCDCPSVQHEIPKARPERKRAAPKPGKKAKRV